MSLYSTLALLCASLLWQNNSTESSPIMLDEIGEYGARHLRQCSLRNLSRSSRVLCPLFVGSAPQQRSQVSIGGLGQGTGMVMSEG